MSIAQDRRKAVDALNAIIVAKGAAQKKMRALTLDLRKRAKTEPDAAMRKQMNDLATQIALQAVELNRENFRLAHARNRILVSMSLSGVLSQLRGLTRDAEKAVERMEALAKVLGAAADMINIIRRFAALVA